MALEKRGNRRFYYRVRRKEGRLVKEYVASGQAAIEAAERDVAERAKRTAAVRAIRDKIAELDAIMAPLHELADLVTEALFFVAGYHRHDRGRWRKKRGKK